MNTTRSKTVSAVAFMFIGIMTCPAAEETEAFPKRPLADFEALFRQYYPKVTVRTNASRISFDYETQMYLIPREDRFGAPAAPGEERGPKRGGVRCEIEYRKGVYNGTLLIHPSGNTREYPQFKLLIMAQHSAKRDAHLYIHLFYPPDVDPSFLQAFRRLVTGFGDPSACLTRVADWPVAVNSAWPRSSPSSPLDISKPGY